MKKHAILFAAALLGTAAISLAQEQASITLDGQNITIKYAPAAAKKYVVASLTATSDIAFKGVKVPRGSYTLYVLPEGAEWKLVVNKAPAAQAAVRNPKLDVGSVALTMSKAATPPACKITLTKTAAVAARIDVAWNGTVASTRMHLDRGGNNSEW
jgi:hypothetical protein